MKKTKLIKIPEFARMLEESKNKEGLFPCTLYVSFYTTSSAIVSDVDVDKEELLDEILDGITEFVQYLGKDENMTISINGLTINSKNLVAVNVKVSIPVEEEDYYEDGEF